MGYYICEDDCPICGGEGIKPIPKIPEWEEEYDFYETGHIILDPHGNKWIFTIKNGFIDFEGTFC